MEEIKTANDTGSASGRVTCKMELCASIQVQCWLTVLCSETRSNAKPQTWICSFKCVIFSDVGVDSDPLTENYCQLL